MIHIQSGVEHKRVQFENVREARLQIWPLKCLTLSFVCFSFTFWQHLRSHQSRYQILGTVSPHHDLIVLPHWETTMRAPWPDFSHYRNIEQTSPCPILVLLSIRLCGNKYQFYSTGNRTPDLPPVLYLFSHCIQPVRGTQINIVSTIGYGEDVTHT